MIVLNTATLKERCRWGPYTPIPPLLLNCACTRTYGLCPLWWQDTSALSLIIFFFSFFLKAPEIWVEETIGVRGHGGREQLYANDQVCIYFQFRVTIHPQLDQTNVIFSFHYYYCQCLFNFHTFLSELLLLSPSCIHSFNKCLSGTYFVLKTVFGILRIA